MDHSIEVLRIQQTAVSKELNRFRPCDPELRCYYCRDWAQYIHKKHFVWSAKTQDDVQSTECDASKSQNGRTLRRKERSPKLTDQFEKLLEENPNSMTLMQDILEVCMAWQNLPSQLSLPSFFKPLEFNSYPDAIPLKQDPSDPVHLLDPLVMERQALYLPSDAFPLLKNLTDDVLISYAQPTCNHTNFAYRSPAELEIERVIYNEKMDAAIKETFGELEKALDNSWHAFSEFLERLLALEKERIQLMGRGCQELIDNFAAGQKLSIFQDYWKAQSARFKNKRSASVGQLDKVFYCHLDRLADSAKQFTNTFCNSRLSEVCALIQRLWGLVVPTIQQMADRMAAHEDQDEKHTENCKAVSSSLKGLHSTSEVDDAVNRIRNEMDTLLQRHLEDIAQLKHDYEESPATNVAGRLNMIAQKDFQKRIKKIEDNYSSMRQHFQYEVTQNIIPETLFCKFTLVCLEALMQEGEMMEAMTIEREVRAFIESHKDLVRQRQALLSQFEDGVHTGRKEFACIIGRLLLEEGMRLHAESLAVKRQNKLLKSMGLTDQPPSTTSKKKSKRKKAGNSASDPPCSPRKSVSTSVLEDHDSDTHEILSDANRHSVPSQAKDRSTAEDGKDIKVAQPIERFASTSANNSLPKKEMQATSVMQPVNQMEALTSHLDCVYDDGKAVKERSVSFKDEPEQINIESNAAKPEGSRIEAHDPHENQQPVLVTENGKETLYRADESSHRQLVAQVQMLYQENVQLTQNLASIRQEMASLNGRYTDQMTFAREREAQTLQLHEKRKQTEMEEVKRYILSLESRIETLEHEVRKSKRPGMMAGFRKHYQLSGSRPW
ncbi:hypothetical protein EC973_000864 [Apophysomyces ossiformis]|uniref:Uncharacterized protein n=1 Tax=Apophysomyces ossiformis TaxID=679940 RepID=A0A8H7EMU2_9FUNG|nr:hypothetical protein EC973_000864 [Apophysomyces ossiformis]